MGLLQALGHRPQSVRLIGLRVEKLESLECAPLQFTLDPPRRQLRNAEVVGDAIAARFGTAKIVPARLRRPAELRPWRRES